MNTFSKTTMFGRLSKGGHLQVREVYVGETAETAAATGILITAIKQTSSDEWKTTVSIDDEEFATVDLALAAWRARP